MSNPLLDELEENNTLPIVQIDLPTHGVFYDDGEVLAEGSSPKAITIRPISLLEETALNDPLMIISGHAVAKIVKKSCPIVVNLEYMCDIDVQTILIGARLASHGRWLDIKYTCNGCPEDQRQEDDLRIDLMDHLQRYAPFDQDFIDTLTIKLPISGQIAMLQPMTYGAAVDMSKAIAKMASSNKPDTENLGVLDDEFLTIYKDVFEQTLDTNMDAVCASINHAVTRSGIKVMDRGIIKEWYTKLDRSDSTLIRKRVEELTERIRDLSKHVYECPRCGKKNDIHLELDPQKLFTLAEGSETPKTPSAESKTIDKPIKTRSKASQRLS